MRALSIVVFMAVGVVGRAQTFDEWFRQKSTQLKYLRQQIAALSAYSGVTEEGYRIVGRETDSIAAIKRADVGLFTGYFGSLRVVKRGIRSWATGLRDTEGFVTGDSLSMTDKERIQLLLK